MVKKILLVVIILALAGYSYFIEPRKLEVNKYVLQDAQLKGIKIVFASDFHIKPYGQKRLTKIVKLINEQNPDLVLSVGDYVCGHTKHSTMPIEDIAKELGEVKSRYGFYTTLGNHDGWYGNDRITKALEKNGIQVLSNKTIKLNIKGHEINIAGVEDKMTGNPDLYKTLDGIKEPIILLTHTPDLFPNVPSYVNLTLAGHTHGGQVRIPVIGPIFTASKYHDKYAKGMIEEKGKKLYVTKGLGVSILPFRFNCIPEIVVIEFE